MNSLEQPRQNRRCISDMEHGMLGNSTGQIH